MSERVERVCDDDEVEREYLREGRKKMMESKHRVNGAHGTHYLSWWGMPLHCLLNRGRRGGGLCMPPRSTPDVQAMMTVSTVRSKYYQYGVL